MSADNWKTAMALTAALLAAAFGTATPALGQDDEEAAPKPAKNVVTVTVTGSGMDKDEATLDAQRKAVEKGAGSFIYSHSEVKDFTLVRDTILSRSAGFLQHFEVVSAKQSRDDETWQVTIKADVSVSGIEDVWGVVQNLLKRVGRPKIMVFISEKIGHDVVENSTVQTRIEEVLLKSGFALVNREQFKEIDKKDLTAAIAEDKPDKAQAIAKRFGAQIFISGTANAARGDDKEIGGVHFMTYEAEANVRCYRSDTAQLMSSVPGVPQRGVQQVARSAAKQALDKEAAVIAVKVRSDILRFWQDALEGRGEIQFHVEGLSFAQYTKLKKALKAIKQITEVNGDFHNGTAEMSLQSNLGAEKLAEKISDGVKGVEVQDVTANVIKAKYTEEK